jgi:hypothetical protein
MFKLLTIDLTALYRNEAPIVDGAPSPKEPQPGFTNPEEEGEILPF